MERYYNLKLVPDSQQLPKASGLFYDQFSQGKIRVGNNALAWTFGVT
jgi:hypothetical protein